MRYVSLASLLLASTTLCATAQVADLTERYFAALQMETVFDILHDEGLKAGLDLAAEDAAIGPSPAWTARMEKIYAADKMEAAFRIGISDVSDTDASEAAIAFFESDLGREIVSIELDARRALGSDEVEEATRLKVKKLRGSDPDRMALYDEFIAVNDLVDSNVSGALNSNLAFYQGLATSELYAESMTESFMLTTVWEQEAEIRTDMEDWTMNFSALAYSSLSEAEIKEYINISGSEAGQKLNAILFAGFDKVFEQQSYELGRAMADFMVGEDT